MPRPFPWLKDLSNIRRSVSNSVRTDYTRRQLELLFNISPRAAGRLVELLATDAVNDSHLVKREVLSAFLERVAEADDVSAVCEQIRKDRTNLSRVTARYRCLRDDEEVRLASLSDSISLRPGRLEIRFDTVEYLVKQLLTVGQAMRDDPLAFEAACEIRREELSAEARDARYIDAEIERMKATVGRVV